MIIFLQYLIEGYTSSVLYYWFTTIFIFYIYFKLVFIFLCSILTFFKDVFFVGIFCLYSDRTDQNWHEAKWEREEGWDQEGSSSRDSNTGRP